MTKLYSFVAFTSVAAIGISTASAAVSYTGSALTQNFDTLNASGSAALTLPGWSAIAQNGATLGTTAADGSSNAGGIFSFGTGTNSERALGGTGSGGTIFGSPATGAIAAYIAFSVTNNSGNSIDSFTINYDGEQWRNGGNASAQTMEVQYGFGATFASVSWTNAPAGFNFTSPVTGSTAAALNGNAAANRTANLGGTVAVNWNENDTLWLRWIERNDAGNDHGLAIDNFSFDATTVPEPSAIGLLGIGAAALLRRRRA